MFREQEREKNENSSSGFLCPGSNFRPQGVKSPMFPLVYVWGHNGSFGAAEKARSYQVTCDSDARGQRQPERGSSSA